MLIAGLPESIVRRISVHANLVLLATGGTYLYRDVWPLLTYTLTPLDIAEGKLLWVKVVLSVYAAILAPLIEPYVYVPVDPEACRVCFAALVHI